MTYCTKLFEGLDKRLSKKMNIDEMAQDLCPDVDDPRRKIIRILKEHKGDKFLSDNADWLGYQVQEKGSKNLTPLPKEEIEIPKEEIEIPKEEKKVCFTVPVEMYNRMAASGIFKELDDIMYSIIFLYLEAMGEE